MVVGVAETTVEQAVTVETVDSPLVVVAVAVVEIVQAEMAETVAAVSSWSSVGSY